jgi:hypothetical protein
MSMLILTNTPLQPRCLKQSLQRLLELNLLIPQLLRFWLTHPTLTHTTLA